MAFQVIMIMDQKEQNSNIGRRTLVEFSPVSNKLPTRGENLKTSIKAAMIPDYQQMKNLL